MTQTTRKGLEVPFTFPDAGDETPELDLGPGAWGTILVPAGSELIGKALQIVAVSRKSPAQFSPTDLLTAAKTLVEGANPLTSDEIAEVGACSRVKFTLDSAVTNASTFVLLWKS